MYFKQTPQNNGQLRSTSTCKVSVFSVALFCSADEDSSVTVSLQNNGVLSDHAPQTVVTRLLCFWEAGNVRKGGVLMWIDMLLPVKSRHFSKVPSLHIV
ncbi:hypothetical protein Bca4012_072563 [Brassica carinata]